MKGVYKRFSSHVHMCEQSQRRMDAQYTHNLILILHFSTRHTRTYTSTTEFSFSFSISFLTHTHTHTTICRQAHTLTHRHMRTPLLAVYHSGLSCCLSNQCMGSFQLQWSEHFIPFPSFPLLNTQTHKYMLRTNTHTLRTLFSTLAHQDRLCSPQ